MDTIRKVVTCTAPVNIAVIKYWGKRDEKLILPINSSISGTLDQNHLRAKTTVMASPDFQNDRIWLNGKEESIESPRIQNILKEVRRRCRKRKSNTTAKMTNWKVHICSENNFPTAAGLASSAAGYACLVFSLAKVFDLEGDISEIARQGSGSACRSVFGGFVEWIMGSEKDGSDSIAREVKPADHWKEMRVLVLVVSAKKKHIGSSAGMQTTVKTSELVKRRADSSVPRRMKTMTKAIIEKDYQTFAELTMKDSNEMHAVCLDTYPPISYMTDTSREIQKLVHAINDFHGEAKVAYTYDAGPNACLYLLQENVPMVLGLVKHYFSNENGKDFVRGIKVDSVEPTNDILEKVPIHVNKGGVDYVISTKIGPGPQVLPDDEILLNEKGLPKSLA